MLVFVCMFPVSYPDVLEPHPAECPHCFCCTVCANKCLCQDDMSSPAGMFHSLNIEIPQMFEDVRAYVQKKIIEEVEEERRFEESSEETSNSSDSSSSSESDD